MSLLLGDCLETLKTLESNSVDSVVTDPPYGLSFMGKKWDYDVPSIEIWSEVLRVLKPGGHVLSFCGTRTYHRMVVSMEDAGFEIRDQLQWIYGSGFPKSMDISKAIDKAAGAEREVVGKNPNHRKLQSTETMCGQPHVGSGSVTVPSTDLAKKAQGWGTALKPANEPICLARKPLIGTVAKNFEQYGTGGLNIDAGRIGTDLVPSKKCNGGDKYAAFKGGKQSENLPWTYTQGRWPANVIFDEEAAAVLDEQSGVLKSAGEYKESKKEFVNSSDSIFGNTNSRRSNDYAGQSGGASRFFYVAKASKKERNAGMGDQTNNHPTIKPLKLMQYLIKLITPVGGVVLDPFMGSGSTGVAAKSLGFEFIGCELSEEYLEIAKKRIEHHEAV